MQTKSIQITDNLYTSTLLHISAIIWVLFKFEILFFSLRISRKYRIPRRKSSLAKRL